MKVYYKHKDTGQKIDLNFIKQKLHDNNTAKAFKVRFAKIKPLSFYADSMEEFEYRLTEIFTSEDFEIVVENDYDLDFEELNYLLSTIAHDKYGNLTHKQGVESKIKKQLKVLIDKEYSRF